MSNVFLVNYLGLLVFCIGILILCVIMLLCGYFLGGRSCVEAKNIPFESGVISVGNARTKFFIKFYLIAMAFVIFDLESIFLYVWSVSAREVGWVGFIEVCVFIFVLLISLVYLIRIGIFHWIKEYK